MWKHEDYCKSFTYTQLYLSNCRNMKIIVNHLHTQLYLSNCGNMKIITNHCTYTQLYLSNWKHEDYYTVINHLHIHSYICLTVET